MTSTDLYNNASKFDEIKSKTEKLAETTIWTTGHYFNVEPFEFERLGFKKGKILNSIPKSTKNRFCYLLDKENRVVCRMEGIDIPNEFLYTFYQYNDYDLKSFQFGNNGSLINAKVIISLNSIVQKMEMHGRKGSRIETYHYDSNVVMKIDVSQSNGEIEANFEVIFLYDNKGTLIQIKNVHSNGYEEIRYKF